MAGLWSPPSLALISGLGGWEGMEKQKVVCVLNQKDGPEVGSEKGASQAICCMFPASSSSNKNQTVAAGVTVECELTAVCSLRQRQTWRRLI